MEMVFMNEVSGKRGDTSFPDAPTIPNEVFHGWLFFIGLVLERAWFPHSSLLLLEQGFSLLLGLTGFLPDKLSFRDFPISF